MTQTVDVHISETVVASARCAAALIVAGTDFSGNVLELRSGLEEVGDVLAVRDSQDDEQRGNQNGCNLEHDPASRSDVGLLRDFRGFVLLRFLSPG